MYILMISRGIPTPKEPQWGCFEQDQAEALQKLGHKVVVASVDSRFMLRWRKLGVTYKHKDGVDYYNSFWIPGSITNLVSNRFNMSIKERQLDRIYKKIELIHGKPDIIYGQFFFNTVLGVFLKKKYGIPLVGIEHAARFNAENLDPITRERAMIAYTNTDRIITVCETLRQRIKYHFGQDSSVVHNLVNSLFFKLENVKKNETDYIQFVSTGSLIHRKGFDILIKSISSINFHGKEVRFLIIGEGKEKNNLQKLIDSFQLNEFIYLLGQKSKTEIVKILSQSDSFILPSRNENFSVAILEALAMGLPVIATDCGGVKECINEDNGLLVPVNDVNALSKAIISMVENISLYDNKSITEDCRLKFSPQSVAEKLIKEFEEVV